MKVDFFKKICICILPLLVFLTGCCRILWQKDTAPYRIVTQVHIVYQNESMETSQDFFQEESIRHILDYLRYIDPYGIPKEDPEQVQSRIFQITLIYSDGSRRIYEQRDDQYLRINGGDWKRIDPQKALYLSGLLAMMVNDAPPIGTEPVPPLVKPQI